MHFFQRSEIQVYKNKQKCITNVYENLILQSSQTGNGLNGLQMDKLWCTTAMQQHPEKQMSHTIVWMNLNYIVLSGKKARPRRLHVI